jgi:hypothetical protein
MVSDGNLTAGPYVADVTFNPFALPDVGEPDPGEPPPEDVPGEPEPEPQPEPSADEPPAPAGEEEPTPEPEASQPEVEPPRVTPFPIGTPNVVSGEVPGELPTLDRSKAMLVEPGDDYYRPFQRLGDTELAEPSRMSALPKLWQAFDQMRADMEHSEDQAASEAETVMVTANGVTLAFSTGLMLMLMRSSSLWAVALSALPMWRRVDPLAVLAITSEERRKLERDLREAEQREDTAGAGLARVLDQTRPAEEPAEEGHAAETDTADPDPERLSETA